MSRRLQEKELRMTLSGLRFSMMTAALCLATIAPCNAQDANEVAALLVELAERGGGSDARYASAVSEGGAVVITDFYSKLEGGEADISIATLRVVEPEMKDDGGMRAARVDANGVAVATRDANIVVEAVTTTNVNYPSPKLPDSEFLAASKSAYGELEATGISVATEQAMEIPIARVALRNNDIVDGLAHDVSFEVEGVVIDTQKTDDLDAREMMKAMGYESVSLSARTHVTWDEPAAILRVETLQFGGEDVGTIRLSAELGGITRALAQAVTQEEASSHLNAVTLIAARLEIENDSIVERSLAWQAAEEGVSSEEFLSETIRELPDVMAMIDNPDLAAQATEALSSFLRDPKTLALWTELAEPVPFAQIVGLGLMAPGAALASLKLNIAANR